MANLLRDMEVVEVRDGYVICAWNAPTSPVVTHGGQATGTLGTYSARTPVLIGEMTDKSGRAPGDPGRQVPAPVIGDRVHDMDDGTRQHVPKGPGP